MKFSSNKHIQYMITDIINSNEDELNKWETACRAAMMLIDFRREIMLND